MRASIRHICLGLLAGFTVALRPVALRSWHPAQRLAVQSWRRDGRTRAARTATTRMMFLEECELRNAADWCKDQPKTRVLPAVYAM